MEIRSNEKAMAGYGKVRLVAAAQVIALLFYGAIVEFLAQSGFVPTPIFDNPGPVRAVLLALSIAVFVASGWLRNRMLQPRFDALEEALVPGERLRRMVTANVVTFAVCEIPALLGFVFFLLGGTRADFRTLFLLSLIFMAFRFPGARQWQEWYAQRARLRGGTTPSDRSAAPSPRCRLPPDRRRCGAPGHSAPHPP